MPNLLEHRFAIKRITKPSNEDYILWLYKPNGSE